MDIVGLVVGAILTLLIFSILLRDNVLYRWALALVVGVAVGYAAAIAVRFVSHDLWTAQGDAVAAPRADRGVKPRHGAPPLLGCLLLFKGFTSSRLLGRLSIVGNIPFGLSCRCRCGCGCVGRIAGNDPALDVGHGRRCASGARDLATGAGRYRARRDDRHAAGVFHHTQANAWRRGRTLRAGGTDLSRWVRRWSRLLWGQLLRAPFLLR